MKVGFAYHIVKLNTHKAALPKNGHPDAWQASACDSVKQKTKTRSGYGSRRRFLLLSTMTVATSTLQACGCRAQGNAPTRTIFDEERELYEERKKEAEEAQREALRAAFDAVQKASEQLDDVSKFVDEKDWKGVRRFSRLFNNSVVREGMEEIARKLPDKRNREEALSLCSGAKARLVQIDRAAGSEDGSRIIEQVQQLRTVIGSFNQLRP
ncbi:hypothetical protein BWQ96_04355 [Gracilariopsis chorda]|uniref:Uncharacterized protein n=1 Tax=Gracilariopsis chorda TaxID=448386 RepID=A0A2V3IXQ1_9FLOR|nr:hypothetical protein BWQ96_04355 [Gracilariopsis chorda]|eukprot:PXF45920.1 hypothetical protein BWQ96_04355 [Gracilariopsis chorda]